MRLRLHVSEEYRRTALLERGEEIATEVELDVPLSEISRKAREVLVAAPDSGPYRYLRIEGHTRELYQATIVPATPADWEQLIADYRQAENVAEENWRAQVIAAARAHIAGETYHWPRYARTGYGGLTEDGEAALPPDLAEAVRAYDEQQAEAKRLQREAEDRRRVDHEQREAAEKAAAEQERSDWIAAHGSDHLRAASDAGYDCKRLYVTERAALEHPGYIVDFDDNAQWRDRSCPSEDALAEELRVTPALAEGESILVVWLTDPPHDRREECDDEEWEPCEAVVIRGFLGDYDLVRTDLPGPAEGDYADLPGGYALLGRTLRHADAAMLCDGHTDARQLTAQHTLVSGPLPEGCPTEGPIPAEMQREMSETGTEGIWFARAFPSVQHARDFAERRLALSARRKRE